MTSRHCNTLEDTATHCNTLQHTATHCNTTLQQQLYRIRRHIQYHAVWHIIEFLTCKSRRRFNNEQTLHHTATQCNTVQHSATHCNILQHTATHCNTLQHTATPHCNSIYAVWEHVWYHAVWYIIIFLTPFTYLCVQEKGWQEEGDKEKKEEEKKEKADRGGM